MRLTGIIPGVLFVAGLALTGCRNSPAEKPPDQDRINYTDDSGRKQGPWEIREDSILVASGSYRNGKKDGLWIYHYPNGNMKEEGRYKLGVKTGMWVEWYPDGELMWKGEYVRGKRHIGDPAAKAEINFIGEVPEDNVLERDHTYRLSIRIQNVPASNLFVESAEGSLTREEETGFYILKTPEDTVLTLAIGFIPELEFKDFRNLVSEINFKIR
jgi:hypothetical protein